MQSAKAMADGFASAGPEICTLPTHVDTWIQVTTEADYVETSGCATFIESGGNAGGSVGETGAGAVRFSPLLDYSYFILL